LKDIPFKARCSILWTTTIFNSEPHKSRNVITE
jgi:hypothetical protein